MTTTNLGVTQDTPSFTLETQEHSLASTHTGCQAHIGGSTACRQQPKAPLPQALHSSTVTHLTANLGQQQWSPVSPWRFLCEPRGYYCTSALLSARA